ncbi:MAG: DUF1499 domain-containing protein [Deltaproteobacteria bacterium]|nr:DUF1499 domain-containing protein [Deltaproteobacteria bacterium]
MSRYWLLCLVVMMTGCSGARSSQIGVTGGRLAPCPPSPNCVCSQDQDPEHTIAPLRYAGTAEQAREILLKVIAGMKRSHIVDETATYLHVEFTSALFRFVDDVEFLFDDGAKTIHVRSASRVGYSDLGVNRRRIETIRAQFNTLTRERM